MNGVSDFQLASNRISSLPTLQPLCSFLLLPLPLTLNAALTCSRADPELVLVLLAGYLDKHECKMKRFCSLFTPRLFDPRYDLGEERL